MTDVGERALTKNKIACAKYNGICHAFNDSGIACGSNENNSPFQLKRNIFLV